MVEISEKAKGGINSAADMAKIAVDRTTNVVDKVQHGAEVAVEKVGEYAHQAGEFAHHAKDKVQHFAEETYDKAGDKLGTIGHDVTNLVKKYPIQALLIGFGAGMLIGRVSRA